MVMTALARSEGRREHINKMVAVLSPKMCNTWCLGGCKSIKNPPPLQTWRASVLNTVRVGTYLFLQETCWWSRLVQPHSAGLLVTAPPKEEVTSHVPVKVLSGSMSPAPCKRHKYQLAGCFQNLCSLCICVGVDTKLETSHSGALISFFLPRQQALFHVLSAYSVYNTVSSKLVQLKWIVLCYIYICIYIYIYKKIKKKALYIFVYMYVCVSIYVSTYTHTRI